MTASETTTSSSSVTDQTAAPIAPMGGGGPGGSSNDWQRQIFNDFKNNLLSSLDNPLAEVERWSVFSLVFAALSVGTVLAGCITALIVAVRWPPGAWTDPSMLMSIVSNIVAALATAANVLVNRQLNAARKELAERRGQIDRLTSRLFKRLFGEGGEPAVVTYAHKDAIAGRFIKVDRENWEEESFQPGKINKYHFRLSSLQGRRIFLEDVSRPKKRNIEIEIDLEFKRVLWTNQKTNVREELYRVIDTD
jgi:hypothetical protein